MIRAVATLPAATGNLLAPGTGFLYLNGFGNRRIDEDWVAGGSGELRRGPAPPMVSHMDLVDVLSDPERAGALCCWNINIAQSSPRQVALRSLLLSSVLHCGPPSRFMVRAGMLATTPG